MQCFRWFSVSVLPSTAAMQSFFDDIGLAMQHNGVHPFFDWFADRDEDSDYEESGSEESGSEDWTLGQDKMLLQILPTDKIWCKITPYLMGRKPFALS